MKAKIFLVFILVLIPAFAQEFNAKAAEEITLKITQTGTLHITGPIDRVNLSLYIPQEDIKKMAFPFERSWNRIAELTVTVNDYIEYDISLVGKRYNSTWILENKKG